VGVRDALLDAARAELAEHGDAGISLRAVARRAGVSHAAPKHHFTDRAGLLTVLAADGFAALAAALEAVGGDGERLTALGHAYVDFGLEHPALFELMFSPGELHGDDPDLRAAKAASLVRLREAVGPGPLLLVSWAFVHGLVTLARDGALQATAGSDDGRAVAHALVADYVAALAPPPA
jgi:AcrR family transcriptional regulator